MRSMRAGLSKAVLVAQLEGTHILWEGLHTPGALNVLGGGGEGCLSNSCNIFLC
jgi:hypothetical protein